MSESRHVCQTGHAGVAPRLQNQTKKTGPRERTGFLPSSGFESLKTGSALPPEIIAACVAAVSAETAKAIGVAQGGR